MLSKFQQNNVYTHKIGKATWYLLLFIQLRFSNKRYAQLFKFFNANPSQGRHLLQWIQANERCIQRPECLE